eukprot:26350-Eustigmatos_ZCMA.PRE.1
MREHVSSHVLQGHVSGEACGFCGSTSCTPSVSANEQALAPANCPYPTTARGDRATGRNATT